MLFSPNSIIPTFGINKSELNEFSLLGTGMNYAVEIKTFLIFFFFWDTESCYVAQALNLPSSCQMLELQAHATMPLCSFIFKFYFMFWRSWGLN
jgi:hypothetical protein